MTGEAGPVFNTQSFPVTGAACMHYPAMIDRVGLCRLGNWAWFRWGLVILALCCTTCGGGGRGTLVGLAVQGCLEILALHVQSKGHYFLKVKYSF